MIDIKRLKNEINLMKKGIKSRAFIDDGYSNIITLIKVRDIKKFKKLFSRKCFVYRECKKIAAFINENYEDEYIQFILKYFEPTDLKQFNKLKL